MLWLLPAIAHYSGWRFLSYFTRLPMVDFPIAVIVIGAIPIIAAILLETKVSHARQKQGGCHDMHETLVIIREGPYRVIRHPGYLAELILLPLLPIALSKWIPFTILAVVYAVGCFSAIAYLIKAEDSFNIKKWGDQYRQYVKEVPAVNFFKGWKKMGLTDRLMRTLGSQARKPSGWMGKITGHFTAWEHKPLTRWAIESMDVQPTDHVLAIGCGSGMAIKLIAQIAVEGFVAGVDYSEVMVQQARKRNAAAIRAGRVEIRHGNVLALPYDDESFDKVIAVETFYFWPDPVANLREVRRVMRPGGLVALVMEGSKESSDQQKQTEVARIAAQMGFPLYSATQMQEMLTAAGFSRAWFESVPDKGWGWLCALGVK